MLNRAILQGRLVADPELRHTQSGVAVATFRIACDRDYKSKNPNAQNADFISIVAWRQTADFISIVAWRQTAEFISRYFTKGSMILVDGRIQSRAYTGNDGQKRTAVDIVAESVNFCWSKTPQNNGNGYVDNYTAQPERSAHSPAHAPTTAYAPNYQEPVNEFAELSNDDGELPF